jgi:type IV pilus assembly protein PilF
MKLPHLVGMLLTVSALTTLSTGCASNPQPDNHVSDKDHAKLLLDVAAANLTENDATSALIALNEVREIDDSIPEEHYLFALAYYQKQETKLAIESARRAVKLKPSFSSAKNTLGKLLLDQGKFDEAEKYLTEAAKDLTSREAYIAKTNLGILYFKKMNFNLAKQWLSSAIRDGGDSACMASYYRGQINLEENQLEAARADLNKASRNACSQFSDAHLAFSQTLIRMKKYDQARAKLLEIKQLFPTSDAAKKANDYLREIP